MASMEDKHIPKAHGPLGILSSILLFPLLLVGVALIEEILIGSVYVASLYRKPIDWLIDAITDLL